MNDFNPINEPVVLDGGLSSSVGNVGNGMYTLLGTIAVIIALVTIFVLVKSILDRKKIKAELSLKTIKSVKTTSIILIVVNALSVITNCFAILLLIMPIISVVFTSKAQKLLESEFDLAKSKVNTASILNIISAILPIVGLIGILGMLFLAELTFSRFRYFG